MEFDKVVHGIVKYISKNIYPGLNDWQTLLARTAVSRFVRNADQLKQSLLSKPLFMTFAIMDKDGTVDLDGLFADLKKHINECPDGKVVLAIPLFGKYTFTEADIDELHRTITEG